MTIEVEDGSGNPDAVSPQTIESIATYHAARGNTAWASGTYSDANREVAAVRASDYIEQRFAARFKGTKTYGKDQGLSFPRTDCTNRDGDELDDDEMPKELLAAHAEYALRALVSGAVLLADPDNTATQGQVIRKKEKVGPLEEETEYAEGSSATLPSYPAADLLLAGLLKPRGATAYR